MTTAFASPAHPTSGVIAHSPASAPRRAWNVGVAALALGALALTAWGIGGSTSDYYASIALSMSESWSNFFFGALDPAGTVTLDKIPGSFWIPALFVKAFGFSPWAVIVPNALAATASVVITAFTARRWAGPVAASGGSSWPACSSPQGSTHTCSRRGPSGRLFAPRISAHGRAGRVASVTSPSPASPASLSRSPGSSPSR